MPWLGTPDNHGYRRPACWCPVKMSLLSTRDDTARGLSSEPRSGRGERQDFVASAVVLDKVRQLCLDKFNVSLGGGLDRLRGHVFRIGHLGDLNEPMILGALAAIEMALELSGVPHGKGGVAAAMDYLVAAE